MRLMVSLALVLATAVPALAQSCSERLVVVHRILDHDLSVGFVAKEVYDQMMADLSKAEAVCRKGLDGQAQFMISATQTKHGYHPE